MSISLNKLKELVLNKAEKLKKLKSTDVPVDLTTIVDINNLPFVNYDDKHKHSHLVVLLAFLYLIPRVYKKRLISFSRICQRMEEDAITNIYRTDGYGIHSKHTHENMSKNYAILAKSFLKDIKNKYGKLVNTHTFTYRYKEDYHIQHSYNVNYLSNTHIFEMIDTMLQKSIDHHNNISNLNFDNTPNSPRSKSLS